jgi:hypothetical protein
LAPCWYSFAKRYMEGARDKNNVDISRLVLRRFSLHPTVLIVATAIARSACRVGAPNATPQHEIKIIGRRTS